MSLTGSDCFLFVFSRLEAPLLFCSQLFSASVVGGWFGCFGLVCLVGLVGLVSLCVEHSTVASMLPESPNTRPFLLKKEVSALKSRVFPKHTLEKSGPNPTRQPHPAGFISGDWQMAPEKQAEVVARRYQWLVVDRLVG